VVRQVASASAALDAGRDKSRLPNPRHDLARRPSRLARDPAVTSRRASAPAAQHRVRERPGGPSELIGIHSNMPGTVPAAIAKALASNVLGAGTSPSGLSADEQRAYDRLDFLYTKGIGYALEMGNRPQTLRLMQNSSNRSRAPGLR